MDRDAAPRVDHMDLAVVATRVRGDDGGDNLSRAGAPLQKAQPLGAVENIDQRLCRDRADARFEVRRQRTNSKEAGSNCDPELPGIFIARDDRPGHVLGHAGPRTRGDGATSPLHNDRRANLGTVIKVDNVII